MSFARAKITRFNEKPNPRAESASGLKAASSSGMKSQIPKINRSQSQPHPQPSKDSARSKSTLDQGISQQKKPHDPLLPSTANSSPETTITAKAVNCSVTDNSVKSEEFKDALDERHEENIGTDAARDLASQTHVARKESLTSRKSSTSGIPLPVRNSPSRVSSVGGSPRIRADSRDSESKITQSVPAKRNLELLFLSKKKKLEQLKRDLEIKQKPVTELYQTLIQMKKKLEESGKIVPLETIKFWDFEENERRSSLAPERLDVSAGGELMKFNRDEANPEYMNNLRDEMEPIPRTFQELGKCLMGKRADLLYLIGRIKQGVPDNDQIIKEVEIIGEETESLQRTIDVAVERQENRIERILREVGGIFENSSLAVANQKIRDLEEKLKEEGKALEDVTKELSLAQQQLKLMKEVTAVKLTEENTYLKERVKSLEGDIQAKKKKISDQSSNTRTYEQKIDILSKQVNDLERTKKDAESKVSELSGHMRTLQNKLKTVEQKWREEKEEILKAHKGEHAILEKLTNERQTLDTRVQLMNTILDEQKKANESEQGKLRQETANAKAELSSVLIDKQILEDKLGSLQQEVARLSVQQQQAVDVIKNTIDPDEPAEGGCNVMTEREAQLRTELLATQVALKAAQERIENYTAEKMRFIDSIEKLNGNGESTKEAIGKALVQKEELITQLDKEKREASRIIENQSVLISQLNAKIDNLQAGVIVNNLDNLPHDTQELKVMLEEGKAKLQKALAKSLENEQKLIKYEHDLNQNKKHLTEMDNLLKVRDGLIGMLKAKKDELLMENGSLHRYSEEIRQLLFDTKEELGQKTEMIQDLTGNLDNKGRHCYKLEKKIKELESTLSETNEKRFKLQDTVGTMEKELQTTKAHISQIAEMQTRYEIGMPLLKSDVNAAFLRKRDSHRPSDDTSPTNPQRNTNTCLNSSVHADHDTQEPTKYKTAVSLVQAIVNEHGDTDNVPQFDRDGSFIMTGLKTLYENLPQENPSSKVRTGMEGDPNKMPERYSPSKYSVVPVNHGTRNNYLEPYDARVYHMKNFTTLPGNQFYRPYYGPYYRPLSQSLLTFKPTCKFRTSKNISAPGLIQFRKDATIQTSPQKTSSSTQTDAQNAIKNAGDERRLHEKNLNVLVHPRRGFAKWSSDEGLKTISETETGVTTGHDPHQICCDLVAKENCDNFKDVSESKIKERREFIEVVNRLSEFEERKRREQLGLGKRFAPILFNGISRYEVMPNGTLLWCIPTKEMRLNNLLISKDILAQSCHQTKHSLNRDVKTQKNIMTKS